MKYIDSELIDINACPASDGHRTNVRRYDLDWLRIIAFSILITFHVCLFFSHWQWFIKNNTITYSLNLPHVHAAVAHGFGVYALRSWDGVVAAVPFGR